MAKENVRLRLHAVVEYIPGDADEETLKDLLRQVMADALLSHGRVLGRVNAKFASCNYGVCIDKRPKAERHDDEQAVAVLGNFAEGYRLVGPYPDFDMAAEAHDGDNVWIATLSPPPQPHTFVRLDVEQEQFIQDTLPQLTDEDALDDLVHDVASQAGSRVNNEGLEAQLRYLLEHMDLAEVKQAVANILSDKPVK